MNSRKKALLIIVGIAIIGLGVVLFTNPCKVLGHKLTRYEGKAATCTVNGYPTYEKCIRCDYSTFVLIPSTGHNWDEWEIKSDPTYTDFGVRTHTCIICGEEQEENTPKLELPADQSIPKLELSDAQKAAKSDAPYVGMKEKYINDTKLGPYDSSGNPNFAGDNSAVVYQWFDRNGNYYYGVRCERGKVVSAEGSDWYKPDHSTR